MFQYYQAEHNPFGNTKLRVELNLSFTTSNAAIESGLPSLNITWSKEKIRLHVDKMKAMIFVKAHLSDIKYYQFYEIVEKEKNTEVPFFGEGQGP
jgi:hypothetical protein